MHCMYAAQPHSLAGNPSRSQTTSTHSSQQRGLPEPALSLSWLPGHCMLLGKRGKQFLKAQRLQWRKPLKRGGTTENQPPFPSLLSSSVTLLWDTPTHPTQEKRGACPSARSPRSSPTAPFTGACVCAGHPYPSGDASLTRDQPVPRRPNATSYTGLCFWVNFFSPSLSSGCHTWWHLVTSGWGRSAG